MLQQVQYSQAYFFDCCSVHHITQRYARNDIIMLYNTYLNELTILG